ncbi:hypothetical protein REPUB_Repub16aG0092800 [Reevesia pubescens]
MTLESFPLPVTDFRIGDGAQRNSTLICVPIMAESVDQMMFQMHKAKEFGGDLVEVRVDFLKNFIPRQDLDILIKQAPLPTLVTYRPRWEGGQYDGDDSKRQEALRLAMELGADYIDIELKVAHHFFNSLPGERPENVKIIVSSHNYERTPSVEELGDLVARIQATGADIVKIATTALDIEDNARMFQVLVHSQVKSSLGGLRGYYNCTIPHKEAALKYCDEVDPIAKAIGAISCMIRRSTDGKLIGYNIDYLGAIAAIEEGLRASNGAAPATGSPLAGKIFVVIGAGGTGKALAYGGYEKGARVVVANRTYDKAKELASEIGGQALTLAELNNFYPEEGMILVNTTSVGMEPRINETPLSKEALKHYSLVFDAVYTPKLTRLLREAQESGATIVYGTEMFINQAFVQFEMFTSLPAPKQLIRDVLARHT